MELNLRLRRARHRAAAQLDRVARRLRSSARREASERRRDRSTGGSRTASTRQFELAVSYINYGFVLCLSSSEESRRIGRGFKVFDDLLKRASAHGETTRRRRWCRNFIPFDMILGWPWEKIAGVAYGRDQEARETILERDDATRRTALHVDSRGSSEDVGAPLL